MTKTTFIANKLRFIGNKVLMYYVNNQKRFFISLMVSIINLFVFRLLVKLFMVACGIEINNYFYIFCAINIPVAASFVQEGRPEAAASGHWGRPRIAVIDQARLFRVLLPNRPIRVPSFWITGSGTPSMYDHILQNMPEILVYNLT